MSNYQVYKFISTKYEKNVEDMTNQAHAPRFSIVAPLLQFNPPQHVTASHPSPGDNHQSTEGQSERTHAMQKMPRLLVFSVIYICTRALHFFINFAHCHAASTVIPLPSKANFTPTNLTSVYPLPALHLHINTLLARWCSSILYTCPNHPNQPYLLNKYQINMGSHIFVKLGSYLG